MKEIVQKLNDQYADRIETINQKGATELLISLKEEVDTERFSQDLRDHLVEIIDSQTIIKVNILNSNQELVDSFATNQ